MLCILRGETCLGLCVSFFFFFAISLPQAQNLKVSISGSFHSIKNHLKPVAEQGALRLLGLMKSQMPGSLGSALGGVGGRG